MFVLLLPVAGVVAMSAGGVGKADHQWGACGVDHLHDHLVVIGIHSRAHIIVMVVFLEMTIDHALPHIQVLTDILDAVFLCG